MTTRKQATAVSAAFREINDRITELSDSWLDSEARELMCECGDATCTGAIAVARSDYEEARKLPDRFLVAPEHVGERTADALGINVLEEWDGYATIEYRDSKTGSSENQPAPPSTHERRGVLDDFEHWLAEKLPRIVADAKGRYQADAGGKTQVRPSAEASEPELT